jgi:hypothetical protein
MIISLFNHSVLFPPQSKVYPNSVYMLLAPHSTQYLYNKEYLYDNF